MKRAALFIAALVFVLGVAACGGGEETTATPETVEGTLPQETGGATAKGDATKGKAVFASAGCGGCHTFEPANSTGTVGPDLDDLAASAKKAGQPLEPFVRESIVNPDGYVTPGYAPNIMPKTFGSLPKSQLDALVEYLVSGGESS